VALTTLELAQRLGMSPITARAAAAELVRTGCLQLGRRPTALRSSGGHRYAQAFALPPAGEQQGARRPRLSPVGLLVGWSDVESGHLGRLMREEGAVPVAVQTPAEARALLRHWGFELLLVAAAPHGQPLTLGQLGELHAAAQLAACGPLLVGEAAAPVAETLQLGRPPVQVAPSQPTELRRAVARALAPSGAARALPIIIGGARGPKT
jgi:hypothetical protein